MAAGALAGIGLPQARRTFLIVHRYVLIRGRVQGVGFRAWTEVAALERRLQGWVRNRRDGAVEALFIGVEDDVLAMIDDCRSGPPGARVDFIDHREAVPDEVALRRRDELFSVLGTL
jgi:acylphosphatase